MRLISLPAGYLLAASILISGCATVPTNDPTKLVTSCAENIAKANAAPARTNSKIELLYYMQLATYEHICNDYQQSIVNFETAKEIDDSLYGISVSGTATSFLISEATQAYKAQNFEKVYLRIFNALNYSILGRQESALVEARQTDYLLSLLNREQGGRNVYAEDAFGRFLTGMLHQEAGDIDNANISYLLALEAYQKTRSLYGVDIPQPLLAAATQVAQAHSPAAIRRVTSFGWSQPRNLPAGAGEVVLLYQVGLIPKKVEDRIVIAWKDGLPYLSRMSSNQEDADTRRTIDAAATIFADDSITVSFPKYVPRRYTVRDLEIDSDTALSISSPALVADIGKIASKDLRDHNLRIQTKTIARAAFYYASLKLLENQMREEGKSEFIIQVAKAAEKFRQIAFEKADTRQWDSLPDQIKMISIVLPAGEHKLKVPRGGNCRQNAATSLKELRVTVTAGKRTFASIRTVL